MKTVDDLEKEKKKIIKDHTGFENNTGLTEKRVIEKKDIFKDWKKEVADSYNQKIGDFKENMQEQYQNLKQAKLDDYPIFMAIAEDIGYDATGKPTGNNELDVIEKELQRFIVEVKNGKSL